MSELTMGIIIIVILGLGWGSFATMAVYRIPRNMPWISDKPHCFKCGHDLNILDYFSVLSYFLWKGKCRYCGVKYEACTSYFATEFGILLLFILAYLQYGFGDMLVLLIPFIVTAVIAAVVDAEHKKIPAKILISFLLIGAIYRTFIDQTFYGVLYGGILGLVLALLARHIYFNFKKQKNIAVDYQQWQDTDRFCGPGFDYVKLMGICGIYLPVYHLVIFSIIAVAVIVLWSLIARKSLRIGTILTMLLVTPVIYPKSIDSLLLF